MLSAPQGAAMCSADHDECVDDDSNDDDSNDDECSGSGVVHSSAHHHRLRCPVAELLHCFASSTISSSSSSIVLIVLVLLFESKWLLFRDWRGFDFVSHQRFDLFCRC